MFVLYLIQVLLVLYPFISAAYSQNSTNLLNNATSDDNVTEASIPQVIVLKINTTSKPIAIVDVEGGKVDLQTATVKSTTDSPEVTTKVYTHHGREGVIEDKVSSEEQKTNNSQDDIYSTPIPIYENETSPMLDVHDFVTDLKNTLQDVPEMKGHNKTVPKKGVEFNDVVLTKFNISTSTDPLTSSDEPTTQKTATVTNTTTTLKPRPKKPTVTIGGNDEESDVLVKNSNFTPQVPTIEQYEKSKERNKSTFVIPIVIVILSVPLVAIIINVVYKRGKEWWSHRHYRRMDFLIDGMYNN